MPVEGDHCHCRVCGKVCAVGQDTCSRACRDKRNAMLASRRTYTYLLYAAIAILALAIVVSVVR